MAYLFYNELGNKASLDTSGNPQTGYGVTNAGPFQSLQSFEYWSGTEYAPNSSVSAWHFYTNDGFQLASLKTGGYNAWAVRPGDVTAVPEPAESALLLTGLGLLGFIASRRKKSA